jgi:serine/threonine-protein kinase
MTAKEPPGDRRQADRRNPDRRSFPGRRQSDWPGSQELTIKRLGRYNLLRELGSGAMAHVYLAEDPAMRRQVAVKTLALADEFAEQDLQAARDQFVREAQAGGRLNHPNIIAIYDFGEEKGLSYIVMEFFPGKPTTAYKAPDRLLPVQWVLDLIAQAADALHYAHGQNVIHRDIKPANLMYDPNADILKISDFGIAHLTDTIRTRTGIVMGTPTYMAPEQFRGDTVDGRADLFSLGVTAYQLLTGTAPFRAVSIPKLLEQIVHQPHEPASKLRANLPPSIDEVLNLALAKDAEDRFPNGRAMAAAVRECSRTMTT